MDFIKSGGSRNIEDSESEDEDLGTLSLIVLFQVLLGMGAPSSLLQELAQEPKFGGDFSELDPAQQRLVREWYAHFNQIIGAQLNPEVSYSELPFSAHTTFEAVTNAAMKTDLTDGA